MNNTQGEIIYVLDALCGWCYGFTPAVTQFHHDVKGKVNFRLLHGGLWPGERARPMDDSLVNHLSRGMPLVTRKTGQQFGDAFKKKIVEDASFIYDTEPAARAAVTARALSQETDACLEVAFVNKIQQAFFIEGRDINKRETFVAIAESLGLDSEEFSALYESKAMKASVVQQFTEARVLGVASFPTMLYKQGDLIEVLSGGVESLDNLHQKFEALSST